MLSNKNVKNELKKTLFSLKPHDHICLIFETLEEWRNIIIPFIITGLMKGQKCIYITDENSTERIRKLIHKEWSNASVAEKSGQLVVLEAKDTYTKDGRFEPDKMIALLISETNKAISEGYSALRATGEMTWILKSNLGVEKAFEYDAKLNHFFAEYPCIAICQYNLKEFPIQMIDEVILTHPVLIWENEIYENRFYIPPEKFLSEKRQQYKLQEFLNNLKKEADFRKKAENELRLSEINFSKVFNFNPSPMAIITLKDLIYLDMNNIFEDTVGYNREEVIGKTINEIPFLHPEVQNKVRKMILKKQAIKNIDVEYQTKSGLKKLGLLSIEIIQFTNQKCILAVINDITKLKRTEMELKQERDIILSILDSSPYAITISDTDLTILDCNPETLKQHKYSSKSELVGKSLLALIDQNEHQEAMENAELVLKNGSIKNIEHNMVTKDQKTFKAELSASVVVDISGKPIFFIALTNDITERKQMEESLLQSENKYRQLVENAQEGIWSIDSEAVTTFVNQRMADILGYTPEEMLGKPLYYFIDEKNINYAMINLKRRVEGIKEQHDFEFLHKNGHPVYTRLETSPILDKEGRFIGALACVADITERKKTEEDLIFLGLHDSLTGLYNRNYFEQEIKRLQEGRHSSVGIIVCDIDALKLVNDSFGHDQGDEHIKLAANLIKGSFREGDIISRIGGDEFAVFLPDSTAIDVEHAVIRIVKAIDEHNSKGQKPLLSISIGSAVGYQSTEKPLRINELFKEADNNMYLDKLLKGQ